LCNQYRLSVLKLKKRRENPTYGYYEFHANDLSRERYFAQSTSDFTLFSNHVPARAARISTDTQTTCTDELKNQRKFNT